MIHTQVDQLNYERTSSTITVEAPSNIAFIKYWGKKNSELQWPANDSISMTLANAKTITSAFTHTASTDLVTWGTIKLNSHDHAKHKIMRHISRLRDLTGSDKRIHVVTENTFPSSCGIASSASGYAALTSACVAAFAQCSTWEDLNIKGFGRENLAHLARLGSGSAGRSMFGGFVRWSAGPSPDSQKLESAFPANHWDLCDVIVVIDKSEKAIPSSIAHEAAPASPLFAPRIAGLPHRMNAVISAIENRDIELLGDLIETDALEMHAIAMTGEPAANYLLPKTSSFLKWTRESRAKGDLPAWFTVDAGPNVHLICERKHLNSVRERIISEWKDVELLMDHVGSGPTISRS